MENLDSRKIKVLIVDDSAVMRSFLTKVLQTDPQFEVVGSAPDPYVAREMLYNLRPDVLTLDIEMPRMDGLTFLKAIMKHFPTRVLIFSSLTEKNSPLALRALELGAIDVMTKPSVDVTKGLESCVEILRSRLKAVASAKFLSLSKSTSITKTKGNQSKALDRTTHQILAIASSTGGTEALKVVLMQLPPDLPGTVIVQHMPPGFTKAYANSLNSLCEFEVKEAENGDKVVPGRVLLAPGNYHMEIVRSGGFYHVKLHQEPLLYGVRPAADYLLKSVAKYAGKNAIGVVLTGMGRDGAQGLLAMKEAGAYNIGQDEASCVVYGMPRAAFEAGALHTVKPLSDIAQTILLQLEKKKN